MKKIILSTVALATLSTVANASTASDIKSLKAQMAAMSNKIATLESKETEQDKKAPKVKAKASVLQFSGTHYLSFVSSKTNGGDRKNKFETRRNYLQVKGYFFEDPKSYMRVTLDTAQIASGDWELRLKYAYLYINNILPFTGVEFGQAHRPWIDYEEHHGWYYRSIAKTFVEKGQDADFTNSADLGINFKTKTDYFSSEIGLFNGAGYHGQEDGDGLSFEWRLTANLLGTGKKHVGKDSTYADLSFYGQYNNDYGKKGDAVSGDFIWYGVNAIYNQPEFLLAANYLKSTEAADAFKGDGYSVNGEFRLKTLSPAMEDWNVIGRYDKFDLDSGASKKTWITGLSYDWNKNVEFILNYEDNKDTRIPASETKRVLFTAEVNW